MFQEPVKALMQMNAGAGVGSQASVWTVTQVWGQVLRGISKVVT